MLQPRGSLVIISTWTPFLATCERSMVPHFILCSPSFDLDWNLSFLGSWQQNWPTRFRSLFQVQRPSTIAHRITDDHSSCIPTYNVQASVGPPCIYHDSPLIRKLWDIYILLSCYTYIYVAHIFAESETLFAAFTSRSFSFHKGVYSRSLGHESTLIPGCSPSFSLFSGWSSLYREPSLDRLGIRVELSYSWLSFSLFIVNSLNRLGMRAELSLPVYLLP